MAAFGKAFKDITAPPRSFGEAPRKPRMVKTSLPKTLNYMRILTEVNEAIARLPEEDQSKIPSPPPCPRRSWAYACAG